MNIFDAIIIFLACGAPFFVYRALQARNSKAIIAMFLLSIPEFLIWPYSAIVLIRNKGFFSESLHDGFDVDSNLDARESQKVAEVRKNLERMFFEDGENPQISIYAFRGVFDRYTGLSRELAGGALETARKSEPEIFKLADHANVELASICLNRRNRSLLKHHHNQARKDLIRTVDALAVSASSRTESWIAMNELAVLLDDIEAIAEIDNIFTGTGQRSGSRSVIKKGGVLWKPVKHIQTGSAQVAFNLRNPATMRTLIDD